MVSLDADHATADRAARETSLLWVGRSVAAVGLMMLLATAALPWYAEIAYGERYTWSGWEQVEVVLWAVVGLALVLALVCFAFRRATVLDAIALTVLGLVAGFFLLGVVVESSEPGYRYGLLVAGVAATVVNIGAGLWVAGAVRSRTSRSPKEPVTAVLAPTPAPAASMAPGPAAAPPGWYADPAGNAAHRWWNGTTWTEHVG